MHSRHVEGKRGQVGRCIPDILRGREGEETQEVTRVSGWTTVVTR